MSAKPLDTFEKLVVYFDFDSLHERHNITMTTFEIYLVAVTAVVSVSVSACVIWIGRTSGRDRPCDPERVQRFVANAPYENLDRVMKPGWRDRDGNSERQGQTKPEA